MGAFLPGMAAVVITASFSANVAARANGVSDARVISFRTDEGLLQPYGVADLEIQIFYDLEENV